jgi:hypothetical protein
MSLLIAGQRLGVFKRTTCRLRYLDVIVRDEKMINEAYVRRTFINFTLCVIL